MKKTVLALALMMALFPILVASQTLSVARANPGWKPWEHKISYPTIHVASPITGVSYPSNHIWLNFTVTKPSDWLNKTHCSISYVSYCVDGDANGRGRGWTNETGVIYSDENEVIVYVQDYGSAMKTSYDFSFNLEGLSAGKHTIEVCVEGSHEGIDFSTEISPRISFTVYPSSPTTSPTPRPSPTPIPIPTATPEPSAAPEIALKSEAFPITLITASASAVAVIVGTGLLFYFKKRHRG